MFAAWVVFKYRLEYRAALRLRRIAARRRRSSRRMHVTWRDRFESLPRFLPFIVLIVVIMVAMYDGSATPSEVAGIGALGALLMVVTLYKCYRKDDLGAILSGTVRESTMIMMIIAT